MKKLITLLIALFMLVSVNVFADDNYTSLTNPVYQIYQSIAASDFTDGTLSAGTLLLTPTLPVGAIPLGWRATISTGFTEGGNITLIAGVLGDTACFSASAGQAIYTAGTVVDLPAATAGDPFTAATTILLTATNTDAGSDFTSTYGGNGAMTFKLFYIRP